MNFAYKQVILVREDLKLSKGKLAVQVAHAAVTSANLARENNKLWYRRWIEEGQKKAVLGIENREKLVRYLMEAKKVGIPACMIEDAGLTEIPPGTATAVAIGPAPSDIIDKITGDLKLL
ncbi:MAG: peptidyl-tRNA hydrolase Pth2 [Candidatus Methanofastidiosia archaeon]